MIYVDCESDKKNYIIWSDVKEDLVRWGVSYGYNRDDVEGSGYIKIYRGGIVDEFIRLKCDLERVMQRKVRNKIIGYYVITRYKDGVSFGKSVLLQRYNAAGEHI